MHHIYIIADSSRAPSGFLFFRINHNVSIRATPAGSYIACIRAFCFVIEVCPSLLAVNAPLSYAPIGFIPFNIFVRRLQPFFLFVFIAYLIEYKSANCLLAEK
jgi:hypothetical protein